MVLALNRIIKNWKRSGQGDGGFQTTQMMTIHTTVHCVCVCVCVCVFLASGYDWVTVSA
jgi:hypothetical protein